jgi:predicted nucleotidyltransferase
MLDEFINLLLFVWPLDRILVQKKSLFGSVARGDVKPSSDVDLAAELDPRACIGLFALGALEQRLAALIGCHVDLLPEPVQKPRRGRTSTEIASVLSSHTSADSLAETL